MSSATPPPHEAAGRRDWVAYFDRMEGKPPRQTLLTALDAFGAIDPADPPLMADIGCGSGRDAAEALSRGWRVWAQDGSTDGLDRLAARPACRDAAEAGRLETIVCGFDELTIPPCDLLNASFSLPFCPPRQWPGLWARIDGAIRPGGRFAGQFFGERDGWASIEDRTHLTRDETLGLFSQYVLESLIEEDRPGTHAGDNFKHWHVFHIVARKIRRGAGPGPSEAQPA